MLDFCTYRFLFSKPVKVLNKIRQTLYRNTLRYICKNFNLFCFFSKFVTVTLPQSDIHSHLYFEILASFPAYAILLVLPHLNVCSSFVPRRSSSRFATVA